MRIRKRAVPLPLSLLSPVPFSDPHLRLVQLPGHPYSNSQPSDHLTPPPSDDPRRLIRYDLDGVVIPRPHSSVEIKIEKNKEQREDNIHHTSKQSSSGAVTDNVVLPPPSTSSNQTEVVATETRWCDGDKAIPLKKRKVSFGVVTREVKMKSKTNKKCTLQNASEEDESDDNDEEEEEERRQRAMELGNSKKKNKTKSKKSNDTSSKSKGKKGGSIMEGSRCSRVNGRGWRCFQPTLVGYSLCEHHLGKGRLRSMSSVRVRASSSSSEKPSPTSKLPEEKSCTIALGANSSTVGNVIQEQSSCDHGRANKKRTRLGVVKARSLSSLLCQPETAVKQHEM